VAILPILASPPVSSSSTPPPVSSSSLGSPLRGILAFLVGCGLLMDLAGLFKVVSEVPEEKVEEEVMILF